METSIIWPYQLVLVTIFLLSAIDRCSGDKATALFGFGDSSADTGNWYPAVDYNIVSAWKNPYGISWPGHPSGRFSSGRLQTDYIAEILGLPSPVPYRVIKNSKNKIASLKGINFAIAGSGVFDSFGMPKLMIQVGHFKELIRSQRYDSHHLERSIVLLSVLGNDYSAVNLTEMGPKKFAKSVITEMALQLREIYNLGIRNFLVSNVFPFDCLPARLQTGSVCLNTTMELVSTHNKYLSEAVSELRELKDANILVLDLFTAFSLIISEPSVQGIHKVNRSCCSSPRNPTSLGCAEYDEKGRALYHLCKHPERYLFFDWYHLTQKGWEVVTNLYYSHHGFVQDGSDASPTSLAEWLHSHNVGLDSFPPTFQPN